jgi:hypothetical protein
MGKKEGGERVERFMYNYRPLVLASSINKPLLTVISNVHEKGKQGLLQENV